MGPIEALFGGLERPKPTGRPLVTLSYAQSLDGSITSARGASLQLSGPESLRLTHELRAAHQAILVGIGTLLADDPRLTVRLVEGPQPRPVVLDSQLRTPPDARLFQGPQSPWIATLSGTPPGRAEALEAAGARLLRFPPDSTGCVPLVAMLETLATAGITSLMVEGGAQVIGAFLQQGLADQVVITIAPIYVGGLPALGALLPARPRLRQPGWQQYGEDMVVWGKLK